MKFAPSFPVHDHQVHLFEDGQVLGDALARHRRAGGQFAEGLSAARPEPVEKLAPGRVRQCLEKISHAPDNMQPNGYMSMPDCLRLI